MNFKNNWNRKTILENTRLLQAFAVVGFGNSGVVVAKSTGAGFVSEVWSTEFSYNAGWRVESHPRHLADVNGDGKADVVGFSNSATVVGLSTGSGFTTQTWSTAFSYNAGWRVGTTPRKVIDITGDRKADVVGINANSFVAGCSSGTGFNTSTWYPYNW